MACAPGDPEGARSRGGFAENPQNCGLFFSPLEPSRKPLEGVKPASGMIYFLFRKIAPATAWKGREGPREMGDQQSDCSGDREQGLWRGAGRARGGPGPQERAYLGGRRNRAEKPRRASGQTPQASYCETPQWASEGLRQPPLRVSPRPPSAPKLAMASCVPR